MKSVLVGYYRVEGIGPDFVETELSGHGPTDYLKLDGEIARRHSGKIFKRVGSRVEQREDNDPGYIEYMPGQSLAQLWGDAEGQHIRVGTTNWQGHACEIYLRIHRTKNTVGLTLKSRGSTAAVFGEQTSGDRLVQELGAIVRGVLGEAATDTVLRVRPKS